MAAASLLVTSAAAQTPIGELQSVAALNAETELALEPTILEGDGFGTSFTSLGDLDGDGVVDFAVGAPEDQLTHNRSAVWILFMNANGSVKSYRKITRDDLDGGYFAFDLGSALASVGDVDGDGVCDLAIGDEAFTHHVGAFWLVFLNPDGSVKGSVRNQSPNPTLGNRFGAAICALGDQDQDGVPDLAVGEPRYTEVDQTGIVWLLFLNADGSIKAWRRLGEGWTGFPGDLQHHGRFGQSLTALGDRDGNGVTDLAIGAPHAGEGEVWVVDLKSKGTKVASAVRIAEGAGGLLSDLDDTADFGAGLGFAVSLGNPNLELFVGAPGTSVPGGASSGAVFALTLASDGTVASELPILNGQGLPAGFLPSFARFGTAIALFDQDGDGSEELAASTYGITGHPGRGVGIFDIGAASNLSLESRIDAATPGLASPLHPGSHFSDRVAFLGDLGGDGDLELAVGSDEQILILSIGDDRAVEGWTPLAPGIGGVPDSIQSFERLGGPPGIDLDALGDFDGDGVTDLLVEATSDPGPHPSEGVWILFLNADGTVREGTRVLAPTNGTFCQVGDIDGDGTVDLVARDLGVPQGLGLQTFFLDPSGAVRASGPTSVVPGVAGPRSALEYLGDLDGDGLAELAVGHFDFVWILTIQSDGSLTIKNSIGPGTNLGSGSVTFGDAFGSSVLEAGDLDQNGVPDLLVGALEKSFYGVYWVLFLRPDGTVIRGVEIDPNQIRGLPSDLIDIHRESRVGATAAPLGDLDGDGTTEVALGVPTGDLFPGDDSGTLFIVSLSRGLWSDLREHSIATGAVQSLEIDAGPEHAGRTYQVFGSLAGSSPGFTTTGRGLRMPLNDDGPNGYLLLTALYPNGLFLGDGLQNGFGVLDAQGRATASFTTLPGLDPAFVGTTFHHAYAVFDPFPTEVVFTSNAATSVLVD